MSQRYCCGVSVFTSAFVQQDEAVLFPVQALDAVSPPPTEQKQRVSEWIQLKLLLDHPGYCDAIFALSESLFIDYSGAKYARFPPKIAVAQKSLF